ncbi:MAG: hypothetical protein DMG38_24435, partial [Acidobacteria bacterium]
MFFSAGSRWVAADQDKGHRRDARRALFEGLAQSRGESAGAIIIEQAKQSTGETSRVRSTRTRVGPRRGGSWW